MKKTISNPELFNVNNKPSEVFNLQLDLLGDPRVFRNFLSHREVEHLLQLEKERPDSLREHRPTPEQTTVTFDCWNNDVRLLLEDKLCSVLGEFDVWGGNWFSTALPYAPHVDTGHDIEHANYKNVIFPLSTIPADTSTHLVVFEQRYFGNNTGFYGSGKPYPNSYTANGELYDYSRVMDLKPGHLESPEILNTHLGHLNPENLTGLSIQKILPWEIGSCIVFDSAQIHCSSDFRRQGMLRKTGFSLFTTRSTPAKS